MINDTQGTGVSLDRQSRQFIRKRVNTAHFYIIKSKWDEPVCIFVFYVVSSASIIALDNGFT